MSIRAKIYAKIFSVTASSSDKKRDKGLTEPEGLKIYRSLQYAEGGEEHRADIYLPDTGKKKYPVIVSVHGGGFVYGDKELYRFYCMDLALRGFAVVNFNYRLMPARYPAPLEDMNDAVRFCLTHAREYCLDTDNVFAVGDSAGALLAGMYTAALSDEKYREETGMPVPVIRFRAIALHSGVYARDGKIRGMASPVSDWLGKDGREMEKNRKMLQLEGCVSAFPPVFLSYSIHDPIAADTPWFFERIKEAGMPCELYAYEGEDKKISHVFHLNIRGKEAKKCTERQTAFFEKYMAN